MPLVWCSSSDPLERPREVALICKTCASSYGIKAASVSNKVSNIKPRPVQVHFGSMSALSCSRQSRFFLVGNQ